MDRQAELKKKKSSTMPTQPAILSKFQMKPALIIATTSPIQARTTGIRTSLGAAQQALTPRALTTIQVLQMPMPGIAKSSKTPLKVLLKG
uniref:Uncharacterized protein n=1 Tax=Romanomermis culicivorax TaxID=13658 RepID=A0A915L9E3_ROMCU